MTLKCKESSRYITTLKESGMSKELFLKKLSALFLGYCEKFMLENTIVVDDSPINRILIKLENVVFLDSKSYNDNGMKDTFPLNVLLPSFI